MFRQRYTMNTSTAYAFLGCLLIMIGSLFGIAQEMVAPEWDELYMFDLWLITYLLSVAGLYCLVLVLVRKRWVALVIVVVLFIGWEFFENLLALIVGGGASVEVPINKYGDIIADSVGAGIVFAFVKNIDCLQRDLVYTESPQAKTK